MRLSQKRHQFRRMKRMLIAYGEFLGYNVVEDQGKRCADCPNAHPHSTHKVGVAIDLLLYGVEWDYLTDPAHYAKLHDFWDFIGGSERIKDDMNHFSLKHQGVR
jgi:hypothetical protein